MFTNSMASKNVLLTTTYFLIYLIIQLILISRSRTETKQKELRLKDLVFIVLSQPNSYHKQRAKEFTSHFQKQVKDAFIPQDGQPELYLLHRKYPSTGSWTIFPIVQKLKEDFGDKSWIIFVEEETRIDLQGVYDLLKQYDCSQEYFLGHALHDQSSTIIHHFAFFENPTEFHYPDPSGGMVFSQALLRSFAERLENDASKSDFTIDYKHELALYLWNAGKGVNLTNVEEFCTISDDSKCVTNSPFIFPQCGSAIPGEDLYVGVKTCEKFHKDRIPVVKKTWGKEKLDIEYFSETEDKTIPTINLGIPNTERGHCGKTLAIMKRFVAEKKLLSKKWLLIADDDTIINLKRLRRLLACYKGEEKVALGERYGYGLKQGHGYDYITGGGGMVFSRPTVEELVDTCRCASNDSPDDMTLGMCLSNQKITITHSPYFHQARPEDYSVDFLSHQLPVSFHKHWLVDPIQVYKLLLEGETVDHDEL